MTVHSTPRDGQDRLEGAPADTETLASVRGLLCGFLVSQSLRVAAELGIADRLANGPRTAGELALECDVHERALYRVLRALAGEGVFAEDAAGRFHLTPMADVLRSDHPRSLRDWARYLSEVTYQGASGLLESVKTGEPASAKAFGMPLFEFLARHRESAEKMYRAMSSVSAARNAGLLQAYDFSDTHWLLDVGGAHGATSAAIAQKHPWVRCTCVDRPNAEQGALKTFDEIGVSDRCTFVPADFFQDDFPDGPDTYLLSAILHDWDDEHCLAILRNCRRQIPPTGRLLVTDIVMSSDRNVHDTYRNCLDLAVMTRLAAWSEPSRSFAAC